MRWVRKYLLAAGASCVESVSWHKDERNTVYYFAREAWVSLSGHDLRFTYESTSHDASSHKGWTYDRRTSQCPEWVLEEVGRALTASRAQLDQTREIVGGMLARESSEPLADWELELLTPPRSVTDRDLGQPDLAAAIAAAKVELDVNASEGASLLALLG
jgi:hypothetical protein